jgi:hypothetical protein
MLAEGVSPHGGTVEVVKGLRAAFDRAIDEFPEVDRLCVTSSYLLCQDSMTDAITLAIADEIERLVEARRPVRLVIADASLSWSKAPLLLDTLGSSAAVEIDPKSSEWSDTYSYLNQFPAMTGREWRVQRSGTVEGHYIVLNPT